MNNVFFTLFYNIHHFVTPQMPHWRGSSTPSLGTGTIGLRNKWE